MGYDEIKELVECRPLFLMIYLQDNIKVGLLKFPTLDLICLINEYAYCS